MSQVASSSSAPVVSYAHGEPPTYNGPLVDVRNLRTYFPIKLDGQEVAVQNFGCLFVLERFVRHDVTPMTRRIADGDEDELVLLPRALQRLHAPRIPEYGVVRVLPQIGAARVDQRVGKMGILLERFYGVLLFLPDALTLE